MSAAVVITGLGTVGPHGTGRAALEAGLAEGRSAFCSLDPASGLYRQEFAGVAGRVDARWLDAWVAPRVARRMSLPSRLAVAAARMALSDAGLDALALAGRDVAVEPRLVGERGDRPAAKAHVRHCDPRGQLADGLGDEA